MTSNKFLYPTEEYNAYWTDSSDAIAVSLPCELQSERNMLISQKASLDLLNLTSTKPTASYIPSSRGSMSAILYGRDQCGYLYCQADLKSAIVISLHQNITAFWQGAFDLSWNTCMPPL